LAAGFAFGLVNLGAGCLLKGEKYNKMIEKLRRYMVGGQDPNLNHKLPWEQEIPDNTLLGPGGTAWSNLLDDRETITGIPILRPSLREELPPQGIGAAPGNTLVEKSNTVIETNFIDTSVTSAGATYALALTFLKTNYKAVAGYFELPKRAFQLREVRYEYVMHRVIARALVMWDEIQPKEQWVNSLLPELMNKNSLDDYLRYSATAEMHKIGKCHFHGIAGACLALGLRFASSNNEEARELVTGYILKIWKLKERATDGYKTPLPSFGRIDKRMIESVLSVLAVSLSLIMAGSGHPLTFDLLNQLHQRIRSVPTMEQVRGSIEYGDYMALSMAIGFLFLGGGRKGKPRRFGAYGGRVWWI